MTDLLQTPLLQEEFNSLINPLGPWGNDDKVNAPIAMAVSGGADSLCLALLASTWRKNIFGFIVDHQLRSSSRQEALITQQRLANFNVQSEILTLNMLFNGSAMEERARTARYDALIEACKKKGCVDLLLGHHAGDQAETVLMRIRAGSAADGLAGIASIIELPNIRLVRPLLTIEPRRLKTTLKQKKISWVEDPSNQDMKILRNRLRQELSFESRKLKTSSLLLRRSQEEGHNRMNKDIKQAHKLSELVSIESEGYALISSQTLDARSLGAVIRTISGSTYTPLMSSLERLGKQLRSITISGVKIQRAGRLGKGWVVFREEAVVQDKVNVVADLIWDQRYRIVVSSDSAIKDIQIGALGNSYKSFSSRKTLPAAILKVLPALWKGNDLVSVPHLEFYAEEQFKKIKILFQPQQPVTQSYLFSAI